MWMVAPQTLADNPGEVNTMRDSMVTETLVSNGDQSYLLTGLVWSAVVWRL
jgi:hypothetical protein